MRWIYIRTSKTRIGTACVAMSLVAGVMMQSAMAAATVPDSVMDAVLAGKAQDLIVLFNTSKVASVAPKLRIATSTTTDDDGDEHEDAEDAAEILAHKIKQYRKTKAHALKVIGAAGIATQQDYTYLPMMYVRVETLAALQSLASNVDVVAVYENTAHQHALIESLPFIGQPSAQSLGKTGAGTTVAVLDTGVNYTLAEFGACTAPGLPVGCRVPVAIDFAFEDSLLDDSGHGTNVAAIIAAVAPGTRIAALDVYTSGYTFTADIIAAINWSIANQALYNIVAINLSLGDGASSATECPGSWATVPFADARAVGILPVVAAGNNAFVNGINGPACAPGAVSVGAVYDSNIGAIGWPGLCTDNVTAADHATCFSNSAAILTLLAPGYNINAGGYNLTGTSQAAPFVAGAIAVLRAADAFPAETLDQTVARMQNTGDLATDPKNGLVTPRLNLGRAITLP